MNYSLYLSKITKPSLCFLTHIQHIWKMILYSREYFKSVTFIGFSVLLGWNWSLATVLLLQYFTKGNTFQIKLCDADSFFIIFLCLLADLCGSWWRVAAAGCEPRQASFFLLLIDALPLCLWELQEAVHGPQVDQQRLRGVFWVLLLPQDLWQQALVRKAHTDWHSRMGMDTR